MLAVGDTSDNAMSQIHYQIWECCIWCCLEPSFNILTKRIHKWSGLLTMRLMSTDSIDPCLLNSPLTKEELINRIQSNNHSAASVLCCLSREFSLQGGKNHFMEDIVGLVALLGTVSLKNLSRSFPLLFFFLLPSWFSVSNWKLYWKNQKGIVLKTAC